MSSYEEWQDIWDLFVWAILEDVKEQIDDRYREAWAAFAAAMEAGYPDVLQRLDRLHGKIAEEAQAVIVNAYNDSHYIDKSHPYRFADSSLKLRRYSNGKMLKALSDKRLITHSAEGIQFIHQSVLDEHAKQWRRLNFGTKKRGQLNVREGQMKFFGKTSSVSVNFDKQRPSPDFFVPESIKLMGFFAREAYPTNAGIFNPIKPSYANHGNHDPFYLYIGGGHTRFPWGKGKPKKVQSEIYFRNINRKVKRKPASGIFGSSFLESGAKYINDTYPNRLMDLVMRWFESGIKAMDNLPAKPGKTLEAVKPELESRIQRWERRYNYKWNVYNNLYNRMQRAKRAGDQVRYNNLLIEFNWLRADLGMKDYRPKD